MWQNKYIHSFIHSTATRRLFHVTPENSLGTSMYSRKIVHMDARYSVERHFYKKYYNSVHKFLFYPPDSELNGLNVTV